MSTNGLTLCIVNYNGEQYLGDTLAAATARHQPFGEIVLVDNASSDRGPDLVRERFPSVRLIRLPVNRGPGAARNAALRLAAYDRILFIDNDVILLPEAAQLLSAALDARKEAVFAMPAVLHAKRPNTVQYDGAGAHFLGMMIVENPELPTSRLGAEPREIDSLITACFIMDRRRWGDAPFFDENFFLYLEDHDVGLRARLLGHLVLSVPSARCLHGAGAIGVSLRQTGKYTSIRVRNTILNRWLILVKLYEIRTLLLLAPALLSFEAFMFVGALARGWGGDWLHAWVGLLRRVPEALVKRRAFQRRRRLGDGEVLVGGPLPFNPALGSVRLERLGRSLLVRVLSLNWNAARPLLRRVGAERRG